MKSFRDADNVYPTVALIGNGHEAKLGPQVLDIGESVEAYLSLLSLPGIKNNESELSFDINRDGAVNVSGVVTIPKLSKDSTSECKMIEELNPPSQFTVSFSLPGQVDPRLVSVKFRSDGLLELVVLKSHHRN